MRLKAVSYFPGAMTTTTKLPHHPWNAPCPNFKLSNSIDAARKIVFSSWWKLHPPHCLIHVAPPFSINNFRRLGWSIRSSVDGSGFDRSSNNSGRPRLIRAILSIQSKLRLRIQELKKNLPLKIFFFLVGFYCATAFATVIGQTGDWDILSAALAVFVVEVIGALMYRAYIPVVNKVKSLISMFNYWKAGLTLGLFLDSFKYELDKITGLTNPFTFDIDVFPIFL